LSPQAGEAKPKAQLSEKEQTALDEEKAKEVPMSR
jgi:hypothetical protein